MINGAQNKVFTGKGPFRDQTTFEIKDGKNAPFQCPSCGSSTRKLIASEGTIDLTCPHCYHSAPRQDRGGMGPNLHQNIAAPAKDISKKNVRLSVGKAWEIDRRVVSKEDGKTVINKTTGKKAQY